MAQGSPVIADARTRRRTQRTEKTLERRHERRYERERQREPESELEDTTYTITGAGFKKFFLSFLVLYTIMAISIFSVFALQDQTPTFVEGSLFQQVTPGEEATFTISVKNPSLLEKEFSLTLEKDIPSGWMASFCDGTQCFYESCTIKVGSFKTIELEVNIITDTKDQTGTARLVLYYEGKIQEACAFTVETTEKPQFTAEITGSNPDVNGVVFSVKIENTGNVPDGYTLFVPPGVSAKVSTDKTQLEPGEKKEVTVLIEEKKSINTSLIVTSDSGLSETLYLISEKTAKYDFELYSPSEFYMNGTQTEVSFDIINMGDTQDTYSVNATCLSSGWEALCSFNTVTIDSRKSERIAVLIKRGEGKSTPVIVTAVSESGLSKNIKLNVYTQETQGKTILAEYFTGTWCYVCSYGEHALRQLKEEYNNLIVLVYHIKDDIETPGSLKRSRDLYGFTETVSTLVVNGNKYIYYSSGGEGTIYFKYKKVIEEMLSQSLKAEIYISGRTMGNAASVTAEIHSYVSGNYDVYFVLFKNDFPSRGEIKQYIVRDVADPQRVSLSKGEVMVSCTFTLPAGESFQGYGVVVIIQDPGTLEVIQANSYML